MCVLLSAVGERATPARHIRIRTRRALARGAVRERARGLVLVRAGRLCVCSAVMWRTWVIRNRFYITEHLPDHRPIFFDIFSRQTLSRLPLRVGRSLHAALGLPRVHCRSAPHSIPISVDDRPDVVVSCARFAAAPAPRGRRAASDSRASAHPPSRARPAIAPRARFLGASPHSASLRSCASIFAQMGW